MNTLSLPVIPFMITASLCLVFTFVVFFLREHLHRFSNAERESLLPLGEEIPRVAGAGRLAPAAGHHAHDHAADSCGCQSGHRPPCSGCLKRPAAPTR